MLALLWSISAMPLHGADAASVVHDETGAYYVVQKGDTLWDISNMFLHSPWYWPEIWSVNSEIPILNPHLIFPGQRLRLFDAQAAPAALPRREEPPRIAALGHFRYPLINRVGFIQDEPETSYGTIFKVRGNKEMISADDTVYIQQAPDMPLSVGDRFTVFRASVPIHDRQQESRIGIQHLITGTLEILQKADTYVIGRIMQSFRAIRLGDQLMAYEARSADIPLADAVAGLSAKIITSEERTYIMGEHDIAFIDKGTADGVAAGQEYKIFEVERVKPQGSTVHDDADDIVVPIEVGKVLVLLTRANASTCLITRSSKSLHSGAAVDFPQN
jgi:hypothetical protein